MEREGVSGLIGVVAQETARYSMFGSSLSEMQLPEGWEVKWRFGHDIAQQTNALIEEAVDRDKDWFWYLGDDHAWSPNLLEKLLAHNEDIVVPLCLMRNPPYRPVIWKEASEDTGASGDVIDGFARINLDDYPDGGLIQVHAAGGAGMLIRRNVLDGMEQPWFEAGRGLTARVGEDINFCQKANKAGFGIYCDLDAMLGHITTTVVWPVREYDGWTYGFSMMGGYQITMPPKAGWMLADAHA
jgi:hypothetical protein